MNIIERGIDQYGRPFENCILNAPDNYLEEREAVRGERLKVEQEAMRSRQEIIKRRPNRPKTYRRKPKPSYAIPSKQIEINFALVYHLLALIPVGSRDAFAYQVAIKVLSANDPEFAARVRESARESK